MARMNVWDGRALVFALLATQLGAQVITTIAGTSSIGPPDGTPALQAPVGPNLLTEDPQGNIYFLDQNTLIMKISPQGLVSRFAGNGILGYSGDGGPAVDASLNRPEGVFADKAGNVFITDARNFRIRKIDSNGIITTVAGNGTQGQSPDGTVAVNASIDVPIMLAVDAAGALYFTETGTSRVKKVSTQGILTTIAGTGQSGYSGDNGPAIAAKLNGPIGVAVDGAGGVIIADSSNYVIRRVDLSGIIRTIAGNGQYGFGGDNATATSATLGKPWTVTVDAAGNILFVDYDNARIRRIDSKGIIATVAGNGQIGLGADNIPAVNSPLYYPFGVWPEPSGSFVIADFSNNVIRRVSSAGIITTIAGNGSKITTQRGGFAGSAIFDVAIRATLEPSGNLLVLDWVNHYLDRINLTNGTISAVAGIGRAAYNGDNIAAANSALNFPEGVTTDRSGNIYIADSFNHRIRKVDSNGIITTIAGAGRSGYSGDNGPAPAALLSVPQGLRFDAAGNLVFADSNNNAVRLITPQGIIRTIAGAGPDKAGYNGDNIPAAQAQLNLPSDVAFDSAGNLYIADSRNHRVRRISNNIITTVAGTGTGGFSGDGLATSVQLFSPNGLNFDGKGNLLIADQDNNRIRLMTPAGQLTTIVGDGQPRWAGDGGLAINASVQQPQGVVADAAGNIFIADSRNNRVREVLATPPAFSVSGGPLSFTAAAAGAPTSAQPLSLSSSIPGLSFSATGDPWIKISPSAAVMPTSISISVDPSQLPAGTSRGTLMIQSPLAVPSIVTIPVTAVISAPAAPVLTLSTSAIQLSIVRGAGGSAEASGHFGIQNTGGGALNATVSPPQVPWLQLSTSTPVSVTPSAPADIALSTASASLASGTYSTQLMVSSDTAGSATLSVTLTVVDARPKILLSQTGLTFTAVAQGSSPLPQSVGILNIGQGTMTWSATAAPLVSGQSWLSIDQNSGTVNAPFTDLSLLNVSINPAGLTAGNYYGQVQFTAAGADNSPQSISVVLNVLPPGSNAGPELRPSGVVFVGAVGSSPGAQTVLIGNSTANALAYASGSTTLPPGANWLQYTPANATVNPGQPAKLVVQADFTSLTPGVQRGVITFIFGDGSIRTLSVLTVVPSPASGLTAKDGSRASGGCSPSSLVVQPTSLNDPSSSVTLSQPASLLAKVVDNCGSPITKGTVVVSFSNQDHQLNLFHMGSGTWSGTWQPVHGSQPQVQLSYDAFIGLGTTLLAGHAGLTVGLKSGTPTPVTAAAVNAASYEGSFVSPGGYISIFGAEMAGAAIPSSTVPLPTQVNGTQVLMGGVPLPLNYVAASQINAQVPFNLTVNSSQQLVVLRGSTVSVPQDVVVAAAQPAVYTKDQSGTGEGVIVDVNNVLIGSGNPAKAGDTVVVYCNGLGAVTPPVPTGSAAPVAGPVSQTVNTLTATIGGVPARVDFAGLTPGFPGLYQVNMVVPPGVASGNQVPVILSIAGQSSPPVTVAIQ